MNAPLRAKYSRVVSVQTNRWRTPQGSISPAKVATGVSAMGRPRKVPAPTTCPRQMVQFHPSII
jgi:hypothetical protein